MHLMLSVVSGWSLIVVYRLYQKHTKTLAIILFWNLLFHLSYFGILNKSSEPHDDPSQLSFQLSRLIFKNIIKRVALVLRRCCRGRGRIGMYYNFIICNAFLLNSKPIAV